MQPAIRYLRTSDGVNLAYWTTGDGPPLLLFPDIPFCHAELLWQVPQFREAYEQLSLGHQLVGFDARLTGLSDRRTRDATLDAHVRDIDAVADCVGLERFALMGSFHGGVPAITFAARHPRRVSHLVLWGAYANAADYAAAPRVEALRALLLKDWEAYAETLGFYISGWSNVEMGRQVTRVIREVMTPAEVEEVIGQVARSFDASPYLGRVRCPTLVMYRRKVVWPDPGVARSLAAAIPDARLVGFDGDGIMPWSSEAPAVLATIEDFISRPGQAAGKPASASAQPADALTERETEVLRLLAAGHSNKEIARELTLSVHTVERHLVNIYGKIGARGRADATAFALRHGLA